MFFLFFSCSEFMLHGKDKVDQAPQVEEDEEVTDTSTTTETEDVNNCSLEDLAALEIGIGDECSSAPQGSFTPIVEWSFAPNRSCTSLPIVADINGDGLPEIIINNTQGLSRGTLSVIYGNGSGVLWERADAELAYGSPVAAGDIDNDGSPEIIGVREYAASLFATGDYTVVAWDANGNQIWESEHFIGLDFDWASAPVLADMDADGQTEIIVGRVILRADGSTRGVGEHGKGSYGITSFGSFTMTEGAVSAVTDLDLDGQQEVIVGNARYDIDGNTIWYDASQEDAMIAIANLDSDPEGEIIASSYNTVRAIDTDGSILWGPIVFPSANIMSPAAIADIDGDGMAEVVVAGGNELRAINHDGTTLWSAAVTDESGATGASIFDFERDGTPEVVYIDEEQMVAFDGLTGTIKFQSYDHQSATMFDYPVIADIDADGQAEILVCHDNYNYAFSVYGDANNSWAPARSLWNQHAYSITNINDDLTIPSAPVHSFESSNTWHSGVSDPGQSYQLNLTSEITNSCADECPNGIFWLQARIINRGFVDIQSTINVAVYARNSQGLELLKQLEVANPLQSGWATEGVWIDIESDDLANADSLEVIVDDSGNGAGSIDECDEDDNSVLFMGPFCE